MPGVHVNASQINIVYPRAMVPVQDICLSFTSQTLAFTHTKSATYIVQHFTYKYRERAFDVSGVTQWREIHVNCEAKLSLPYFFFLLCGLSHTAMMKQVAVLVVLFIW